MIPLRTTWKRRPTRAEGIAVADRPRRRELSGLDPREVGLRGAALNVQSARAQRAEKPGAAFSRERRQAQADDHANPPAVVVSGDGDRSRPHTRDGQLAERPVDRLQAG